MENLTAPGDRRVCGSRNYEIVCVSVTTAHLNVIFRFMAAHSAIAFVEKFKCLVKFTLFIFYTISRSITGVIRRVIDDMPQAQTSFSSPRCSEGL